MTLPAFDTRLFQIATQPLDPADWLDPDAAMITQLAEKARLRQTHFSETFAALPESTDAQRELLTLLVDYLPGRFPKLWRREGDAIRILLNDQIVPLDIDQGPLLTASRLVQDDLLLLTRDEPGWRLVAASLSFPSSWQLAEKIGKVLDAIHEPVPGFGPDTRPAQLMARMFDSMRPETPMIRWNWSLHGDNRLYHPDTSSKPRFGMGERADPVHLRIERQTLRKLPRTGVIVFTIRISLVGIDEIETLPGAGTLAASLIAQLEALSPEQLDYKGLSAERERILLRLADIS